MQIDCIFTRHDLSDRYHLLIDRIRNSLAVHIDFIIDQPRDRPGQDA